MIKSISVIAFILLFTICTKNVSAQASGSDARKRDVADKDKVWTPGSSPEQKAAKKGKSYSKDTNTPLTKKELGKKLKKDEKEKKENYEKFHDKMQSKKVRKRMKENEKKSKSLNNGDRPSLWRKIKIWFHKK